MDDISKTISIGIFDSGVGGLSAVRALQKIGCNIPIKYFGDTARVPYGTRDAETITTYARQDLHFLLSKGVSAVLVACGTVSSVALDSLKRDTDIPIYGIVDTAARAAIKKTKNKRIAVLATEATVNSHSFSKAIHSENRNIEVIEISCPLFVPLVENGYIDSDNAITRLVASEYLEQVKCFDADTVILGCTHFPLLKNTLKALMPEVSFIDSSYEAAKALHEILYISTQKYELDNNIYYISGSVEQFKKVGQVFIGHDFVGDIQRVPISDYATLKN